MIILILHIVEKKKKPQQNISMNPKFIDCTYQHFFLSFPIFICNTLATTEFHYLSSHCCNFVLYGCFFFTQQKPFLIKIFK